MYNDLVTLRKYYSLYIKKQLEEKNEFVQMVPFYETKDSVRETLLKDPNNQIERKIRDQILTIIDASKRFAANTDYKQLDETLINFALSKQKKGVSILSDYGYFLFNNLLYNLFEYELDIDIQTDFSTRLKMVCLYNQKDFDRLSTKQKKTLVDHHTVTIKI